MTATGFWTRHCGLRTGASLLVLLALLLCAGVLTIGCSDGNGGPLAMGSGDTADPYLGNMSPSTSPESDSLALVDEAVQGLDWGNIAFNAPDTMDYGHVRTVELVLSPTLPVSDLQSQLEDQTGVQLAQVQISNRMEARLTGSGFDIVAMRPDLQAVTTQHLTRWVWEVTPTGHGTQKLHLSLSAHIDLGASDTPLVVRTFDRDIVVEVALGQRVTDFLEDNWNWMWAAVVVPCCGYGWATWKKRRPKSGAGASEGR
jgi:hypothetical protein